MDNQFWIRPYQDRLGWRGKGLLYLVVLTFMGGFIGSPFWWMDEARSFSWDLPPLASRIVASAGWAFCVACFFALQRPTYWRLRLVLLLLFAYLSPLAVVILLFHLDRFDPAAPITYAFFMVVILMIALTLFYLLRQPTIMADETQDIAPASRIITGWLGAVALICGLWGVALFITDAGPIRLIWVWTGDLLSSRLIGVMLLTITAGAVFSMRYADVARWNMAGVKPIPFSYLIAFGSMAIVSAILLPTDKQRT